MDTPTSRRSFTSACILAVEVHTNTPCGGDSGHGGRTVVRLINEAGVDMDRSEVVYSETDGSVGLPYDEIVLSFGGDAEAGVLADALIWAGREIKRQAKDNRRLGLVVWPDVPVVADDPFFGGPPT